MWFCTYVLESQKTKKWFIGTTTDLRRETREHEEGLVRATRLQRPAKVIYFEAYRHPADAARRERYLKSTKGQQELRDRLKRSLKREHGSPHRT